MNSEREKADHRPKTPTRFVRVDRLDITRSAVGSNVTDKSSRWRPAKSRRFTKDATTQSRAA
jgi:hypothetical protein